MSHIFISHATKDDPIVTRIHERLEAAGLDAWADHHDIVGSDNWNQRIQAALNERPYCVFVLSPHSAQNENCEAEWWSYLNKREEGRRLYVVLTAPIEPQHFPWRLRVVQHVDLSQNFDLGMQTLITAIQGRREIRHDDPASAQGIRITGHHFPYGALDIPLYGRADDLNGLQHKLSQEHRLWVVSAAGGTGKTRLTAELAIRANDFKDGVVWHRIEAYSKVNDLTESLRDHLNLDVTTPPDAVWQALQTRQVLLILDNAEFCQDKAAYSQRLEHYPLAGGSRAVMTSREHWRETKKFNSLYELKPLSDLEAAANIVGAMAAQQNVRAQVQGHEAAFAQAARLHPRLIQYALGWLHDFPLARVLTMLTTLKGGEDMQEALQDILQQTLDQMTAQAGGRQALADLQKLLVCRAGFSDAAAEALLGQLDSIPLLRRWNLILFDGTRYSLDPLLQSYLPADPSAAPAHFDFYKALAWQHDEAQDYQGLDVESENLEAAFEWAMSASQHEQALNLLNACGHFLPNRGRFEQALGWGQRVAQALENQPDKLLWANAQNSLGTLYQNYPLGDRRVNLDKAIACYQVALVYWTPQSAPLDYAMTQNNLGTAYSNLAKLQGPGENLDKAITCFQAALEYYTPHSAPLDYATTQNNLGILYGDLAKLQDTSENLQKAIECYQAALVYWTPQSGPLDYAMTQYNLGILYSDLAKLQDTSENLQKAIECYQAALVYWTPQSAPLDYAMTQYNLGITYGNLAQLQDSSENLNKAIACFQGALEYYTPQSALLDYAMTQNNLGIAYGKLAQLQDPGENLNKAIACYQAALQYRTPQSAPLDYAATQNNLGNAYSNLAALQDPGENLHNAIECYQAALVYWTPQSAPLDYAMTQNNLGTAYGGLAKLQDISENIEKAIACFQDALVYRTPQSAPLNYAETQCNLGIAYEILDNLTAAISAWHEAELYYRKMGYEQKANQMLAWIADGEARLAGGS